VVDATATTTADAANATMATIATTRAGMPDHAAAPASAEGHD
jgi:hypothetical protein